jgi:hypothetical protein
MTGLELRLDELIDLHDKLHLKYNKAQHDRQNEIHEMIAKQAIMEE